jgi:hypothetical protein
MLIPYLPVNEEVYVLYTLFLRYLDSIYYIDD